MMREIESLRRFSIPAIPSRNAFELAMPDPFELRKSEDLEVVLLRGNCSWRP